ncbi:MAG: right-handed parallel beta-helix repeat-containing protein [Pseudobdellovibrionaceae bacterium]
MRKKLNFIPSGPFTLCLIVIFWSGLSTALASATYYVDGNNNQASDSNPGTQTQPWKTIQKASTAMIAGDTTIVVGGTYNEQVKSTRN